MKFRILSRLAIAAIVLSGTLGVALAAGPDLTVTDCSFRPAQPKETDNIMINATFKNVGDEAAVFAKDSGEWTSRVQGTPKPLGGGGGSNGRSVAPNTTFAGGVFIIQPGDLAPGTYVVKVTVDPDSRIRGDANRGNNTRDCSLTIAAGGTWPPDLMYQELKLETANPTTATVAIVGTVKNIGKGAAVLPAGPWVTIADFGDATLTQSETIAPGTTKTFRITPSRALQPGRYTWHAVIPLPDSNFENSHKDIFTKLLPSGRSGELVPDLVVDSCVFDPPAPARNQAVKLKVVFKNVGNGDAKIVDGGYEWKALYQGRQFGGAAANPILVVKPGETFGNGNGGQIFAANQLPVGTSVVTVQVDPDNWVVESNHTNNDKACSITVH